eukprot:g38252.t1
MYSFYFFLTCIKSLVFVQLRQFLLSSTKRGEKWFLRSCYLANGGNAPIIPRIQPRPGPFRRFPRFCSETFSPQVGTKIWSLVPKYLIRYTLRSHRASVVSSWRRFGLCDIVLRPVHTMAEETRPSKRVRVEELHEETVKQGEAEGDGDSEEKKFWLRFDRLPIWDKPKDVKEKFLQRGVEPQVLLKMGGKQFGFMCFPSQEDRDKAFTALSTPDPATGKVYKVSVDAGPPKKKQKNNPQSPQPERPMPTTAREVVCPWADRSYEDQIAAKTEEMRDLLKKMSRTLRHRFRKDVEGSGVIQNKAQGLIAPLEEVVTAPVRTGYRNKSEFSIGKNAKGEREVGFRLGKFGQGGEKVEFPVDCPNTSAASVSVCRVFREYLREQEWDTYHAEEHTGVWRMLLVRQAERTGELLVLVRVCKKNVPDASLEGLKKQLVQCFTSGLANPAWEAEYRCKLKSVNIQYHDGVSDAAGWECETELLWGDEFIVDKIDEFSYRISANSFFQVNTSAAEALYGLVRKWTLEQAGSETVAYDICCGTGTIAICLAKHVKKVIGLELIPAAVEDARQNAIDNGITNVEFIEGKAEHTLLKKMDEEAKKAKSMGDKKPAIVGILDPPRSGLHGDTVKALRRCAGLDTLIYVCCNPKTLTDNLERLMCPSSKRYKGEPFTPIKAALVDLFPHTPHIELVVMLKRKAQAQALVDAEQARKRQEKLAPTAEQSTQRTTHSTGTAGDQKQDTGMPSGAAGSGSERDDGASSGTGEVKSKKDKLADNSIMLVVVMTVVEEIVRTGEICIPVTLWKSCKSEIRAPFNFL